MYPPFGLYWPADRVGLSRGSVGPADRVGAIDRDGPVDRVGSVDRFVQRIGVVLQAADPVVPRIELGPGSGRIQRFEEIWLISCELGFFYRMPMPGR